MDVEVYDPSINVGFIHELLDPVLERLRVLMDRVREFNDGLEEGEASIKIVIDGGSLHGFNWEYLLEIASDCVRVYRVEYSDWELAEGVKTYIHIASVYL